MLGRKLVMKYLPERVNQWQMQVRICPPRNWRSFSAQRYLPGFHCNDCAIQVAKHRENLLNYIIFLRVTPFLPNWFINIASPVIDVPLAPFFWGTFIGEAFGYYHLFTGSFILIIQSVFVCFTPFVRLK
jgi:hypothetical protein